MIKLGTFFIFYGGLTRQMARLDTKISVPDHYQSIARIKKGLGAKSQLLRSNFKFSDSIQIFEKRNWPKVMNVVEIIYPILAKELSIIYEGLLILTNFGPLSY
jgi:hypothetical protein